MHTPLGFDVLEKADSLIPPLAGSDFPTCAIYDDGSVKCWDEEETDKYVHACVVTCPYFAKLHASPSHTLTLTHTCYYTHMHMLQLQ